MYFNLGSGPRHMIYFTPQGFFSQGLGLRVCTDSASCCSGCTHTSLHIYYPTNFPCGLDCVCNWNKNLVVQTLHNLFVFLLSTRLMMLLIKLIGSHFAGMEEKHSSHLYLPAFGHAHLHVVSCSANQLSPPYSHDKSIGFFPLPTSRWASHYSLNVWWWSGGLHM